MQSAPTIPHYALVAHYAAQYQHTIPLMSPATALLAGAPVANAPLAHPLGHLWGGASVYHTPSLGLSYHHKG